MKASRQVKLEGQLVAAESALLDLLASELPHTAHFGNMLFFNSEFCPEPVHGYRLVEQNETLLSLAKEAIALREQIGLPVLSSVGQLFLSACSEAANAVNDNRRGPRQLATWLIGELGPNNSFKPKPLRGSA
jgi:hypothetical protein